MSLEAMEALTAAEETVRRMRADAAVEAKQKLTAAREKGEQMVSEAMQKAKNEISELSRQSDEKAKADAVTLVGNNENRKAAMRARAESKAEKAAAFIVERIVNS